MKISIVGAGNVGGLTAMRILEEGIAEVVLVDIAKGLAKAKAFDLDDARYLIGHPNQIEGTEDFSSISDSDVVVVTAGLARKPGMTREDLLKRNYDILKEVAKHIKNYSPNSIVICVSNPVDIMAYVMLKETGFNKEKVLGMGAGLDTSRFANLIAKKLNVPTKSVNALVMGSHGQTMIPLPRFTTVDGKLLTELLDKKEVDELVKATKERGAEIVSLYGSGSAYFAPSAAILDICYAIVNNDYRIIPVACYLEGEHGVNGIYIGVPAKINRDGVREIIQIDLNEEEKNLFFESAKDIKASIDVIFPKT